jgi:hypothetical protein
MKPTFYDVLQRVLSSSDLAARLCYVAVAFVIAATLDLIVMMASCLYPAIMLAMWCTHHVALLKTHQGDGIEHLFDYGSGAIVTAIVALVLLRARWPWASRFARRRWHSLMVDAGLAEPPPPRRQLWRDIWRFSRTRRGRDIISGLMMLMLGLGSIEAAISAVIAWTPYILWPQTIAQLPPRFSSGSYAGVTATTLAILTDCLMGWWLVQHKWPWTLRIVLASAWEFIREQSAIAGQTEGAATSKPRKEAV